MDEKRPAWDFKTPEDVARWIDTHSVTKITHHWEMTGVDTSHDWVVFHDGKATLIAPTRFQEAWPQVEFSPNHRSLIQLRLYHGVEKKIEEIDKWTKANQRELSEYKRLKAKFEGARISILEKGTE